jgi:hypothetical protein
MAAPEPDLIANRDEFFERTKRRSAFTIIIAVFIGVCLIVGAGVEANTVANGWFAYIVGVMGGVIGYALTWVFDKGEPGEAVNRRRNLIYATIGIGAYFVISALPTAARAAVLSAAGVYLLLLPTWMMRARRRLWEHPERIPLPERVEVKPLLPPPRRKGRPKPKAKKRRR